MEFVVLLSVFAITITQVIARPAVDTKDDFKTKDGATDKEDASEKFKFKLPTLVQPNFTITLSGYLDFSQEKFTAVLKGDEDNSSCTLNFNYKTNDYFVASPALSQNEKIMYEIKYETEDYMQIEDAEFTLNLDAKVIDAGNVFEVTFNGYDSGNTSPASCKIESFDIFSHIHFQEGVKSIKSILFTF